jgi:hypothetical protein
MPGQHRAQGGMERGPGGGGHQVHSRETVPLKRGKISIFRNCPFKKRKNLRFYGGHFSVELHHPFPQPRGSAAVASVSTYYYILSPQLFLYCVVSRKPLLFTMHM